MPDDRLDTEIRFRGSKRDVSRLAQLSKHFDMNVSALLRRLIVDAHRATFKRQTKGT